MSKDVTSGYNMRQRLVSLLTFPVEFVDSEDGRTYKVHPNDSKCIIGLLQFASRLRKAREVHPDKQPSSSGSTSSFHEVSAAYEALMG